MDFTLTTELHASVLTFSSTGFLLLCQHHYCELSTPSLASSSVLETKDLTTILSTTFKSQHDVPQTRTSVISTTSTHTTRLQRITVAPNDETLIDVTTSIDSLCLTKSYDPEDTNGDNYSIKSISGDIIVTIILHHSDNATETIKFIVNHINGIDLLVHNVTIGEFSKSITPFQILTTFFFQQAFALCKLQSLKISWTFLKTKSTFWSIASIILSVS